MSACLENIVFVALIGVRQTHRGHALIVANIAVYARGFYQCQYGAYRYISKE